MSKRSSSDVFYCKACSMGYTNEEDIDEHYNTQECHDARQARMLKGNIPTMQAMCYTCNKFCFDLYQHIRGPNHRIKKNVLVKKKAEKYLLNGPCAFFFYKYLGILI